MEYPVIKKIPLDVMDYAFKLGEWIKENQATYFNHHQYKAKAWRDFDFFDSDEGVTRRSLVMPDEHLLIDRDFEGEHWFVICRIYGKVGGTSRCKHIFPVIKVEDLKMECWRNGYFLLPKLD